MKPLPKKQQGVAIVVAMLVVALATIVAAEMAFEGHLNMRRAAALRLTDQAQLFAIGAEDWAGEILIQDLANSAGGGPSNDNLSEYWALDIPPLPLTDANGVEIGQMWGTIEDMQSRFNITNLIDNGEVDPTALQQFECMLTALDLDVTVAGKVVDWLDADANPQFPNGAEDDYYTGLEPPYLVPNTLITSVSELLAVDGMTREAFAVLEPYIIALPQRTLINVNTVERLHDDDPLPTLQCMEPNLNQGDAENIIESRPETGYADMNDFSTLVGLADANNYAQVDSSYFRAHIRVSIGTFQLSMYSLLQRGQNGDVTALLRTFGAL